MIENDILTLTLVDTGSHSDIFKKYTKRQGLLLYPCPLLCQRSPRSAWILLWQLLQSAIRLFGTGKC